MSEPLTAAPRAWPFRLSLLAILVLAAALRWTALDLIPYTFDEAEQIALASGMTGRSGAQLLLGGGTQMGLQRSSLHASLLAVPLALSGGRVEAAVWWMGALGVLAVAAGYRLGAAAGGPWCGLLTALFLAANPWIIQGDRRLWAHVYLAISVAMPWLAWEALVRRRAAAMIALPVLAAAQLMTHLLGLLQALSWLAPLLLSPRTWLRRAFALGIGLAACLFVPYVWALATQTDWNALQAPALTRDAPKLHWEALTSSHTWPPLLRLAAGLPVMRRALFAGETGWVVALIYVLIGIGLLRLLVEARGSRRALGARLFLLWPVGPLLILALRPLPVYEQYWTVLLPFPALLTALGLDQLRRLAPRAWLGHTVAAAVAATVVVVWLVTCTAELTAFAQSARGATLRFWRETVALTVAHAQAGAFTSVRFALDGRDPAVEGEPAAVATLLALAARGADGTAIQPRFLEAIQPPGLLLDLDAPSLYLWLVNAPEQEAILAQVGELVATGPVDSGQGKPRLYRVPAYEASQFGVTPLSPAPRFDAGLQLLGTQLPTPRAGEPARYTLAWHVFARTPDATGRVLTAFNHILDAQGGMAAQTDGLSLLSRDWWPGDVLLQSYEMTLPAGSYVWRVGLYSLLDGGRAYLLDQSDWIDHVDIPFTVAP